MSAYKLFGPPPAPKTELGRYRQLSPRAGVHVSPIQLGAMSIGDKWEDVGFGSMNKEASFKLLDAYYDNGGNFIDTANNYQDGSSEAFIGEWAETRGIRDELFIATKYTINWVKRHGTAQQQILFAGNNVKSMAISIDASLKRLRTHYIDLFYVHVWDWTTSIEELMKGLNNLVVSGKVLYLGISDTPAWVVAKANQYARDHGLAQFVVYQGHWNVLDRSFEREIIPMAYSEGMALAPWGVLGSGKVRTDEEEEKRKVSGENGRTFISTEWERSEQEKKLTAALTQVAGEVGAKSIQAVAIAYVMHKAPFVFPILGGRKVEHLLSNVEALKVSLTPKHIQTLEAIAPFDLGFPGVMIGNKAGDGVIQGSAGLVAPLPKLEPVKHVA